MSSRDWRLRLLFLIMVVVFGMTSSLFGQSDRGTITGVVADQSGAVIPKASVTATNISTGVKTTVYTTSSGDYTIPQLRPATYRVTVEVAGFKTGEEAAAPLLIGQTIRVDFTMQVGQTTETVQVTGATPLLHPDSTDLNMALGHREVEDLPLALHAEAMSPVDFIFLAPGVTGQTVPYGNNTQALNFSTTINGGQALGNEIQIDGTTIQDTNIAGDFRNIPIPVEAVQEFKLETSNFSAEYGRTGGGIITFVTRSGTNGLHGSAFELLRNNALDSRGFFLPSVATLHQNEFGVTVGGPVIIPKVYNGKNKTFFFFYYDGFRYRSGAQNALYQVPTMQERNGDFSDLVGSNGQLIPIYDPATGNPDGTGRNQFSCNGALNVICPGRLSSVAQKVVAFLPKPDFNRPFSNLYSRSQGFSDVNYTGFKIDHAFNEKHRISYVGSWDRNQSIDVCCISPLPPPLSNNNFSYHPQEMERFSYDWIAKPNLVEHLGLGFDRSIYASTPLVHDKNYAADIGLKGVLGIPGFPGFNFNTDGYTQMGSSGGFSTNVENNIDITDSLTWSRGRHTFKFGADIRKNQENLLFNAGGDGQFYFGKSETSLFPSVAGGNSMASFMLGQVDSSTLTVNTTTFGWRYSYYGFYGQDDFKITSKLTMQYGLRWEAPVPRSEAFGRMSSFDPNLPNPGAGGIPGAITFFGAGPGRNGRTHILPTYLRDWGPRLGLAYRLNDKTVLRGGYGIYYGAGGSVLDNGERTGFGEGYFLNVNRQTPNSGITPGFLLDNGFPTNWTPPPIIDPSVENGSTPFWTAPGTQRAPYIGNWNLDVQRQFGHSTLIDVAYVGAKGTRLSSNLTTPDQVNPKWLSLGSELTDDIGCLAAGTCPNSLAAGVKMPYAGFTGSVAQALAPYPQYFGIYNTYELAGSSTYNSLQVKVEKRFSNDLNFLVAYTASKELDNAASNQAPYFAAAAQDSYNRKAEKSIGALSVPQNLVFHYTYQLPFGPGKYFLRGGGVAGKIVGGWEVAGIHTYQSGLPVQAFVDDYLPIFNGGLRPNVVRGQPKLASYSGKFDPAVDMYLNPNAFTTPAPFTFGNAAPAYDDMRGFPYFNEDFSLIKRTYITETKNIEFRCELFNAFNRTSFGSEPRFGNPVSDLSAGNYGQISAQSNSPRQIQFGLKINF